LSIIVNIKYFFARLSLRIKPLSEHITKGNPVVSNNGSKLLFFFLNAKEDIISLNRFTDRVKSKYSNVQVVAYSNNSEMEITDEVSGIQVFQLKNFNIFGMPDSEITNWVKKNRFDILMSFADNPDEFGSRIINMINADFKVGRYNKQDIKQFDLTVALKSDNYSNQLDQYFYYLENLNINI
jgi:uncharacterized protein DUF6913